MLGVFQALDRSAPANLFSPHVEGATGVHNIVYKIAQASIYQEIGACLKTSYSILHNQLLYNDNFIFCLPLLGPVDLEVRSFADTIVPLPYNEMEHMRKTRAEPKSSQSRAPHTYILTVASDETDGLRALRTSAFLAGVNIEVRLGHNLIPGFVQ